MNFQNLIDLLGIPLLAQFVMAFMVAIGFLISYKTHMATVSWNG